MTKAKRESFLTYLNHLQNLLLVLLAAVVGILLPELGPYTDPLVTPLVILLVFSSLNGLHFDKINSTSYYIIIAFSLFISYILLPIGGIHIAASLLSDGSLTGMAIILAAPTTAGSAIIWTRLSDGDDQLSTVASVVSLLLAPVFTPVIFGYIANSQVNIPVGSILLDLLVIIGGGVLLAVFVPKNTIDEEYIDRGAGLAILLLIYSSVANIEIGSLQIELFVSIVFVVLLVLGVSIIFTFLLSWLISLEKSTILPLFFTSSFKNLGIALFIAFSYPSSMVVVSIVVYYVIQQLVGAIIADLVS